jgi:hypothetical protein
VALEFRYATLELVDAPRQLLQLIALGHGRLTGSAAQGETAPGRENCENENCQEATTVHLSILLIERTGGYLKDAGASLRITRSAGQSPAEVRE